MTDYVEPETIVQPSNHTLAEYCDIVLSEAEERGIDVSDLQGDLCEETLDETLGRIADAGYAWVEADDTLLIWPKGVEVPKEWRE